jgi:hypothetical protein
MNTARVCLSALLVALTGLSCAAQSLAPLVSVRTWGDLRAQPPVAIAAAANDAPPLACRIGINFAAAKLYGGVVVYCLAKEKPARAAASMNLGPFQVEVQGPKNKNAPMMQAQQLGYAGFGKQASGETLFMKSLPLNEPGDYIITVKRPLGGAKGAGFETVASTTITVAIDPGPIWSPWPLNAADGAVGILATDEEYQRNSGTGGVANPSTGVAIPKMAACFTSDTIDTPSPNLPLPELLPSEPDSGIKVQATGNLLIVTLDHGITPAFADEKFLTRWWVNGQPFTPKLAPMEVSMEYGMRHNGMQSSKLATQITFQVEFHPEFLGVKKGDEIGVQLLLCPQGSEYSGPVQIRQWFNDIAWEPVDTDVRSVEPRLSNRVTFTYTGDPIRMAPLAR